MKIIFNRWLCLYLALASIAVSASEQTIQPIHVFDADVGPSVPRAGLTPGPDGNLYGTTYSGSSGNQDQAAIGTVFGITTSGSFSMLVNLARQNATGLRPMAGLVFGPDGNLYGTTSEGGKGGNGTIFRVSTNGNFTNLANFGFGVYPVAHLTIGPDGNFYGTTQDGGSYGNGTVFRVTSNGLLTTLASFTGGNGSKPNSELTSGPDGNLYGTTSRGGNNNSGTIFRINTNGVLTMLLSFNAMGGPTFTNSSGAYPKGGLTLGLDGKLYGTTDRGGVNGYGVIFKVSTTGVFTPLLSFNGNNGAYPQSHLVLGPDSSFYGTTSDGGPYGEGTVFRITTDGALSSLVAFDYDNGANPMASLTFGPDGNFYGTTSDGGSYYSGTVFRITTNGILTTLVDFTGGNGLSPLSDLTLGTDDTFFGTTRLGGQSNAGTIFQITTNGTLTTLFSFPGPDAVGALPSADLTLGQDGKFYGTTSGGGDNGAGTVFSLTTNGSLTTLASFHGSDSGANPMANLTLGSDGNFYGTCLNGGPDFSPFGGTIFKISTDDVLTTLIKFRDTSDTNGASPESSLIMGRDGNLYGTARSGGNGNGTVFQATTNGALTALVTFNGSDGSGPKAGLAVGTDGLLYGTTSFGGSNGNGTVFKVSTNGSFTEIASFAGTNGADPRAALTLGPDGDFYGTTFFGGRNGLGTVFRVSTNGLITVVGDFDGANGSNPWAKLTLAADGNLYGTAPYGGSGKGGVIYRVNLPPTIVKQPTGVSSPLGGTTRFEVLVFGTSPFNYQWYFNGVKMPGTDKPLLSLGPLFTNLAGNYQVIVTNLYGSVTSDVATLSVQTASALYGISQDNEGKITLLGAGIPGTTSRLWTTTNLSLPFAQWQVIATNSIIDSFFELKDSDPALHEAKFYRLSTP